MVERRRDLRRIAASVRVGIDGRLDGEDTIFGDGGGDAIAGDNTVIERALAGTGAVDPRRPAQPDALDVVRRITRERDVALVGTPAGAGTSGDDVIYGNDGVDVAYGQGGDDRSRATPPTTTSRATRAPTRSRATRVATTSSADRPHVLERRVDRGAAAASTTRPATTRSTAATARRRRD